MTSKDRLKLGMPRTRLIRRQAIRSLCMDMRALGAQGQTTFRYPREHGIGSQFVRCSYAARFHGSDQVLFATLTGGGVVVAQVDGAG